MQTKFRMTIRTVWMLGALLLSAACTADSTPGGDQRSRTFEREIPASAAGVVEISNVAGLIDVTGWDRAAVQVVARLGRDVERVELVNESGRIRVRVVLPRKDNVKGTTDLTVRVPKDSSVEVSSVSADVRLGGTTGRQDLQTVSGDVQTEIAGNDIEVTAVSGDIRLRGSGAATNVRVNSVSGDLTLERIAGVLNAVSVSGDVALEMDDASDVRVRTTSGDVRLRAGLQRGARLEMATVSGDLTANVPAVAGFTTDIKTFSGDISNCFGAAAERTSQYGPGQRLDVRHGEGAATVRLKSMSGDIDICDR